MRADYVHVEVLELNRNGGYSSTAMAEVRVAVDGHAPFTLIAKLSSTQAPFWRVVTLEAVGSEEVLEVATDRIGFDELCYRISVAAALWNVWDSAKAASDRSFEQG